MGEWVSQLRYASLVGSLMYLMHYTRSNISFDVGMLSRFTSYLGYDHWNVMYRVLKYIYYRLHYKEYFIVL